MSPRQSKCPAVNSDGSISGEKAYRLLSPFVADRWTFCLIQRRTENPNAEMAMARRTRSATIMTNSAKARGILQQTKARARGLANDGDRAIDDGSHHPFALQFRISAVMMRPTLRPQSLQSTQRVEFFAAAGLRLPARLFCTSERRE
jgi:hypothetical protein